MIRSDNSYIFFQKYIERKYNIIMRMGNQIIFLRDMHGLFRYYQSRAFKNPLDKPVKTSSFTFLKIIYL